jgi:hypothetical protein
LGQTHPLPGILGESSGVAWSRARPDVLFSHNDGGDGAFLYALDRQGSLLGKIPLAGATNQDWEDLATGPCDAGFCIYVADSGDNGEIRDSIVLYRAVDSGTYDGTSFSVAAFPMVLPDGPRDIESLFVLPGERVFLVSKGRSGPVTLYRYPSPLRAGETVTLEEVQTLSPDRLPIPQQVTGADASPDGSLVAIRTYEALTFYRWLDGLLMPLDGGRVALRTLDEAQGEAVGLGPGGELALTSEGALGRGPTLNLLACPLWDTQR